LTNDSSYSTKKMDDVPDFIEVKGVVGKRVRSTRYYADGFKLRVEYLFDLKALHEKGAAKYYDSSQPRKKTEEAE